MHHIGYTGIAIMCANGKRVSPHVVRNITYRNMGGGIGSMKESTAINEENVGFEDFYAGIGHTRPVSRGSLNGAAAQVLSNPLDRTIDAGGAQRAIIATL